MKEKNKKRSWKQIVSILSCIVVFCTTYALILPAVTLSTDTYCGKEAHTHDAECYREHDKSKPLCGLEEGEGSEGHTHTEDCYGNVEVGRNLICGMEEVEGHVHDDSCYQSEFEYGLICGKEESEPTEGHVHNEDCYISETPICGKEEHEHSRECYSNKEDVEDPKDWEEAYKDINKEEDAKTRILTVAKNEVGYKENKANFSVDENDAEHYYTRYGHLYEDMYGDWNNYFTGYVLKYANVKMNFDKDISKWQNKTIDDQKEEGEEGNVVFFRDDEGELRSGIVTKIDSLTKEIRVIEGDVDGEVKEERVNKDKVIAYLSDEVTIEDEDTPLAGGDEFENSKTYEDDKISVKVSYNDDADIPENAELVVKEITEESDPEHYNARKQEYLELMGESDDADTVDEASEEVADESAEELQQEEEDQIFLLHDISFQVDGEEIEPKTEVKVEIVYKDEKMQDVDSDSLQIVHFKDDDTKEMVEPEKVEKKDQNVETHFKTNSFSEYVTTFAADGSQKVSLETVPGINVPGLKMTLFDYSSDVNQWSPLHFFSNYGKDNGVDTFSNQQADSNSYAVATSRLTEEKFLVSWNDNNTPKNAIGLFDNSNRNGKTITQVPEGGGSLFQYDSTTKTYYYDSLLNAASWNGNSFTLYDKPVKIDSRENDIKPGSANYNDFKGLFLPFNNLNTINHQGNLSTKSNNKTKENYYLIKNTGENSEKINYYFGMNMEFKFLNPKDGKMDSNPMKFEFTGDDDVYVFVDDVLILDLGGTHGPRTGTIDFSTGKITHSVTNNPDIATTLRDAFKKAGYSDRELNDIFIQKDGAWIFKNYSEHTLKFFYLERGGSASNCRMKFNLPTIPENSLQIAKELTTNSDGTITQYLKDNLVYRFKVLKENTADTSYFETDVTYKIYPRDVATGQADFTKIPTSATLEEDGFISLRADQVAVFEKVMEKGQGNFYIQEWLPDTSSGAYGQVNWETGGSGGVVRTEQGEGEYNDQKFTTYKTNSLANDETHIVRFQNVLNVQKLSLVQIEKKMANGITNIEDDFTVLVQMKDQATNQWINLPVGTEYKKSGDDETYKIDRSSTVTLKAGQIITFESKFVGGTELKVTEQSIDNKFNENPDYQYQIDNGNLVAGSEAMITVPKTEDENHSLKFVITNKYEAKVPNKIQIKKVDNNTQKPSPLQGAKFKLYEEVKSGGQSIPGLPNVKVIEVKNGEHAIETELTDKDGITELGYSLDPAKVYYLIESKTPDGYLVPQYGYKLFYNANGNLCIATVGDDGKFGEGVPAVYTNDLLTATVTIQNTPGQALPNTGGAGTKLFTFSGAAVIAASGLMYGYKKKKDKRNGKGGLRK